MDSKCHALTRFIAETERPVRDAACLCTMERVVALALKLTTHT